MTGEKGEENLNSFIGSRSLLNVTLSLHHHDWVCCTIHLGVNATNLFQCHRYVQEKSLREFTNLANASSAAIPSLSIFHDRHPEPYIIRSFSPPQKSFAPFRVVDVGYIKALLRQVTSCWHQLIIQEVDLEITLSVLWSLHALMASFSLPTTGLH